VTSPAPSGRWPTLRRIIAITREGTHVLDCGHVRVAPSAEEGRVGRSPMLRCVPCRKNADEILEQLRCKRGDGLRG
jgi:hypothetical protein